MSSFTNKLRQLISEKGITQKKFLSDLNLNINSVGDWQKNGNIPKGETLKKIADYFNVSVDWLNDLTRYRNDKELKKYTWKDYDLVEKFEGYGDYFDPAFDFGGLIREERERLEFPIKEMADAIGYSEKKYLLIEEGERPITQVQAEILCHTLYTTVKQLLLNAGLIEQLITPQKTPLEVDIRASITYPEVERIKKYRALDEHGKEIIDIIINKEYERCLAQQVSQKLPPTIRVKHSVYKASAGFGFDLEDRDEWDEIDIPDTPEAHEADFAVTIYGNSMEPIYHDSDIVLVKIQDRVNIGETGIFVVNGQGYIKQYGGDRLISVNSDYKDIVFTEGDFIKCAGKVIGIA